MHQDTTRILDSETDIAARLMVAPRTMAEWRRRGFGPRWIKLGKHVRYSRDDVDRWIGERTRSGSPEAPACR